MRTAAAALILVGLIASPLAAQSRNGRDGVRAQGIPPGHLPPAGACRVWYDGVPPGKQPAATSCREAERVAARNRDARVIYGGDRDARTVGRAVPRSDRSVYPDGRYSTNGRYSRGAGYGTVPFDNGYRDGLEKGREDAGDRDRFDPARHGWYRSANRGYQSQYGSKADYSDVYRRGFLAGYDDGRGRTR